MMRTTSRTLIASLAFAALGTVARAAGPGGVLEVQGAWYRPHTNTAYVYVRNTGDAPVTFDRLLVNGRPESAEPAFPLDPQRKTHWFDFIPSTVPPAGVAQVRVNLREAPEAPGVELSVEATGAAVPLKATVAPEAPKAFFTDIAFAPDGSSVALFVGGETDLTVRRVLLDGHDVTDRCDLRGGRSFQRTAVVSLRPGAPLARGSYHTYQVDAADGRTAIYTARTLPGKFVLGTYGNTEHFSAYADNALNHYTSFRHLTPALLDQLESLGLGAGPVPFVGGIYSPKTKAWTPLDVEKSREHLAAVKDSAAVDFYSCPDEPDGYDSAAKERGLHGRVVVAMRQLAEQVDPATPSFVQIDNSLRPHNYRIYSEAMDYSSTHRYNLGQEFFAGDREATGELRASSQPQPYLWVTQLYPVREKAGERVQYNGRNPTAGEMHVQMLEAVANGSKGVIHYIHSGSTGGRGGSGIDDPALWAAMKPMHQQLAAVGPLVARSTPTTWAAASVPEARAVALLCDPDNVLVVVTNQAAASTKTDFTVPALPNVTVTVAVPPWAQLTEAVQVMPGGGLRPLTLRKDPNHPLALTLETLEVGSLVWLRGAQAQ